MFAIAYRGGAVGTNGTYRGEVANQAAMLSLSPVPSPGAVVKRIDTGTFFTFTGSTPSSLASWTEGAIGPQGPMGNTGATGLSAYAIAQAAGFAGTQSQWLASLVGPEGPASTVPGPKGDKGDTGPGVTPEQLASKQDAIDWLGSTGIEFDSVTKRLNVPSSGGGLVAGTDAGMLAGGLTPGRIVITETGLRRTLSSSQFLGIAEVQLDSDGLTPLALIVGNLSLPFGIINGEATSPLVGSGLQDIVQIDWGSDAPFAELMFTWNTGSGDTPDAAVANTRFKARSAAWTTADNTTFPLGFDGMSPTGEAPDASVSGGLRNLWVAMRNNGVADYTAIGNGATLGPNQMVCFRFPAADGVTAFKLVLQEPRGTNGRLGRAQCIGYVS